MRRYVGCKHYALVLKRRRIMASVELLPDYAGSGLTGARFGSAFEGSLTTRLVAAKSIDAGTIQAVRKGSSPP